jgi:cytochrome c peroxidase
VRRSLFATIVILAVAIGPHVSRADAPWDLPPGIAPPAVPDLSTLTPARVELGRRLFYDARLSMNGTQSCGTCHRPEFAFTDTRPRAIGATHELHPRGSMSLINVAYRDRLTWADPTLTSLEEQVLIPMFGEDPIELGLKGREARIYEELASDGLYLRLFGAAFPNEPTPISTQSVAAAIATFERTIVSFRSPYDRFHFRGEKGAMSPAARRGEALFFSRDKGGCFQCHGGLNFDGGARTMSAAATEPAFHNTGLFLKYAPPNTGLQAHSGRPEDEGKFRAPTLRNIARTAPYMHDGSISTLQDVLDHYAAGGRAPHPNRSPLLRPFMLTREERADLIAFLDSLTDIDALVDSRWSDPWQTKYAFATDAHIQSFGHDGREE